MPDDVAAQPVVDPTAAGAVALPPTEPEGGAPAVPSPDATTAPEDLETLRAEVARLLAQNAADQQMIGRQSAEVARSKDLERRFAEIEARQAAPPPDPAAEREAAIEKEAADLFTDEYQSAYQALAAPDWIRYQAAVKQAKRDHEPEPDLADYVDEDAVGKAAAGIANANATKQAKQIVAQREREEAIASRFQKEASLATATPDRFAEDVKAGLPAELQGFASEVAAAMAEGGLSAADYFRKKGTAEGQGHQFSAQLIAVGMARQAAKQKPAEPGFKPTAVIPAAVIPSVGGSGGAAPGKGSKERSAIEARMREQFPQLAESPERFKRAVDRELEG